MAQPSVIFFKDRAEDLQLYITLAGPPYHEEIPQEVQARISTVAICKAFGWSLDYVRGLDPFDKADIIGCLNGWEYQQTKHLPH